ncbi:GNAT family N-acetyltransferase [Paenibacillus glycanilyticus]|uniref:GNAT family N-acetyltransferase n=1 Tax=Paenibacillus glycanilyticus TaxID=126569 RepID=UPI0020407BFB|nr:GNAT family N-acetyltransferase [Paenibacillus glycanilyticus]MCM3631193.1 GNAT family N-acetyltransferase [Paenibacillus glycanilyticus]
MIDKQSMPLDSELLRFRRLVSDDLAQLAVMLQDPKVMYAWEHTFTDQQVREWIDRQLDDYRNDGIGYFAAIEKSTGELVGQIGAHWSDYKGRRVLEVCYMLKHAFTGRGYALERAKAMIEHAGTKLHVPEIYAYS